MHTNKLDGHILEEQNPLNHITGLPSENDNVPVRDHDALSTMRSISLHIHANHTSTHTGNEQTQAFTSGFCKIIRDRLTKEITMMLRIFAADIIQDA